MKRLWVLVGASLVVVAAVATPVAAFRGAVRAEEQGLFRDTAVCTDGIAFDIGHHTIVDVGFPENTLPEPLINDEDLFITTGPNNIFPNPAFDRPDLPGRVLDGEFEADPIANNDPYWSGAQLAGSPYDPTGRKIWVKSHVAPWVTALAVGTELNVYIRDDMNERPVIAVDTITVTDCTVFEASPCDAPGAILGTAGDDLLIGTAEPDVICGFGGNDRIIGYGGDDLIYGGEGDDSLFGNRGDDTIYGEAGNDRLWGQLGDDILNGGDDDDHLLGFQGDDILNGGDGDDILRGGMGVDILNP